MKQSTILKYVLSCFLLFVLPLVMMVFGNQLPPPLLFENFSKGIPPVIEYGETIFRYAVMILAVFMPLRISTQRQKIGLAIYMVGVILYVLSWIPLILFPQSAWSTSLDRVFGNGIYTARVADWNWAGRRFILRFDTLQAVVLYFGIYSLCRIPYGAYAAGLCANFLGFSTDGACIVRATQRVLT